MDILKLADYLKLKGRIRITIRNRPHKAYAACHYTFGKSHRIDIWLYPEEFRGIETLIAHELIHAWQDENGYKRIHGKRFQTKAAELLIHFGIPNIYLKAVDK